MIKDLSGAAYGSAGERCMALPVVVPVGQKTADDLRERMIEAHQTEIEIDEPEDDAMALLLGAEMDRPVHDDMSDERLLRALMEAQEPR